MEVSSTGSATANPASLPRQRLPFSCGRCAVNTATAAAAAVAVVCLMEGGRVVVVWAEDLDVVPYSPRSFDGVGNNEGNPEWGTVGTTQIRSVVGADYADSTFSPNSALKPTAREVMTEVFLSSPPAQSTKSALFIAWGQLIAFDLSLTNENSSEPFDVPCNDAGGLAGAGVTPDVWCPQGSSSDPISFFRSDAALSDDWGALPAATRNPINYATAFVDLDFVYGRSEQEAQTLRALDGSGFMKISDSGLPLRNDNGTTWLVREGER